MTWKAKSRLSPKTKYKPMLHSEDGNICLVQQKAVTISRKFLWRWGSKFYKIIRRKKKKGQQSNIIEQTFEKEIVSVQRRDNAVEYLIFCLKIYKMNIRKNYQLVFILPWFDYVHESHQKWNLIQWSVVGFQLLWGKTLISFLLRLHLWREWNKFPNLCILAFENNGEWDEVFCLRVNFWSGWWSN